MRTGAGGYRPPARSLRSHLEKSRWPPDVRLVHHECCFFALLGEGLPNLKECPLARASDRAGHSTQAADAHLVLLSGLRPAHFVTC